MPRFAKGSPEAKAYMAGLRAARAKQTPETPKERTLEEKINADFQVGISPLNIAIRHNCEVADVYRAVGQPEMTEVRTIGDLEDRGPNAKGHNPYGTAFQVPYTKN